MHAKSTRPSAKREVQEERSAKRVDQIARPRRAQTCERSELRAMRLCPLSGQIFFLEKQYILRRLRLFNFSFFVELAVWQNKILKIIVVQIIIML